jgi:hypothetical protein
MAIETEYTSTSSNRSATETAHGNTESLTDTVLDTMVRGPIRLTGATVDFVKQGVQRITGSDSGGGSVAGGSTVSDVTSASGEGQDLGGDDLKYVMWSIVFTKPGEERILQPQQEELVNYAADERSYAAVKIAQYLNGTNRGHRTRATARSAQAEPESERLEEAGGQRENGLRIRPEDQKFIVFLYRVDRRLAKREESTRVERVTIERSVD